MERKNVSAVHYLLLVPGVGFILLFIGSSIFITVTQSFGLFSITGKSQFTLENWRQVFVEKESLDSILFSMKMGLLSSIGTLLFAFPVALFLRKGGSGKRFLASLIKIPLFIPALVAAFLIINLISFHGIINETLMALHIINKPLRMLNDKFGWGVVAIQVWKNIPFVLLILSGSLASIRDDTVDAARNLGAGAFSILFRIYIPLAMPAILVSMILMFIKAFGDFAITSVAGPTYPPSIALRMRNTATMFQQWDKAAVLGVIIILTTLFVTWIYSRLAQFVTGGE
ncbi:MAG TPA: ABC transporter permease [Rectinemataceae bacterium]|nr:ABC transporter permease [Rectinemataceae bacterium]